MIEPRLTRLMPSTLGLVALLVPSVAFANPRPLPFTYPYGTLGQGSYEVEQYVDLDPVKALSTTTGKPTTFVASELQTEFEVGLTDHVELGLYATFVPQAGDSYQGTPVMPEGNGAKERIRGRFAEEGKLPIDVALYGELTQNEREFEIEGKIILARRIGPVHIDVNLTSELELYYDGTKEIVVDPSAGLTVQVAPVFHPGLEYWVRAEFPIGEPRTGFNRGPHHYLGPAMMFDFGRVWWTVAGYFRLSDLDHVVAPGDAFGQLWFRNLVGINF